MIFIKTWFFHIELDLFAEVLLIIATIHALLHLNLKILRYKFFASTSIVCLLSIFIEISASLIRDYSILNYAWAVKLSNTLSFALLPITPLFIYYFIRKTTTGIFDKRHALIVSIPAIVNVVLSLLSYNLNIYFDVSITNMYSRGALFFVFPLINLFYYVLTMTYVIKNAFYLEKDEIFVFLNTALLPLLMGSIQLFNSMYLTICSSYAFSLIIFYIFILNDNSKRDIMTGLGNKAKYYDCIKNLRNKCNRTLKVIYFDLDDFKKINDTYGHAQGDIAIQEFSHLIYETFKIKSKIIRFGGDEFIVFTFNEQVYSLLKILSIKVDKFNSSEKLPFELKYSYGIADKCNSENSSLSIEELIKKSDDSLYINKKLKHSSSN